MDLQSHLPVVFQDLRQSNNLTQSRIWDPQLGFFPHHQPLRLLKVRAILNRTTTVNCSRQNSGVSPILDVDDTTVDMTNRELLRVKLREHFDVQTRAGIRP
ncbi:hypothetical protein CIHG_01906 [Coccidioides immitis H538.4]|uniref:Uncharacterized protein n=2 Tax=Coccidioides immitis TaxID=5501 RepID=A0A0J8RG06_COCIT|nr:hypothetical protein CIRG_06231 [Coccidioides immitis RMSCC 2394]KMU84120.1 hypothetical protein CIHG_01906 [Coccidioides immitis H538.4]